MIRHEPQKKTPGNPDQLKGEKMSSEYMFSVIRTKPSRKAAKHMDRICKQEGGLGFSELNVKLGTSPGVNGGQYMGWFSGPNRGEPFDGQLAARVTDRVSREVLQRTTV